jgi:hypothetical protein
MAVFCWRFFITLQTNNPLWPDAQPYDTYFFVAVAIITVWVNRDTMFTRAGSVINVIPGESRPPRTQVSVVR